MIAAEAERFFRQVAGASRDGQQQRCRPASAFGLALHQNLPLQVPAQPSPSQASATGGGSLGSLLVFE